MNIQEPNLGALECKLFFRKIPPNNKFQNDNKDRREISRKTISGKTNSEKKIQK